MDIVKSFASLQMKNASVHSLLLEPYKRVAMEIAIADIKKRTMEFFELRFCRVLHISANLDMAGNYGNISDYVIHGDSEYLSSILEYSRFDYLQKSDFYHFGVTFTVGNLNIIAEDYTYSSVKILAVSGDC